jgi:phage baseplate assembly protein W
MNGLALKLAQFIPENLQVYTVLNNDSLPLIAARQLGNFELWPQIATINNLQPPYIGAVGAAPSAGLVIPGQQIFLPVNPTTTAATAGAVSNSIPNYEVNYLGVDLFLGPLNEPDMLPWTGDFNTQSGFNNLATALGRRIITTLGSLIFHPEFGSRIPPEVGGVSDSTTASNIGAYATSAILTDPRVNNVTNVSVTNPSYGQINVSATATPNGSTAQTALVNEVLQ